MRVNLSDPIATGETITASWAVRVTLEEEFKTTGLFIARPVADQTLPLSDGAVDIDLRGVASSMESQEVIAYSATSDDGAVVTADMDPDGYTLTLTPQSAGSTTITLAGNMPGTGAAEQTLSVTVE